MPKLSSAAIILMHRACEQNSSIDKYMAVTVAGCLFLSAKGGSAKGQIVLFHVINIG